MLIHLVFYSIKFWWHLSLARDNATDLAYKMTLHNGEIMVQIAHDEGVLYVLKFCNIGIFIDEFIYPNDL